MCHPGGWQRGSCSTASIKRWQKESSWKGRKRGFRGHQLCHPADALRKWLCLCTRSLGMVCSPFLPAMSSVLGSFPSQKAQNSRSPMCIARECSLAWEQLRYSASCLRRLRSQSAAGGEVFVAVGTGTYRGSEQAQLLNLQGRKPIVSAPIVSWKGAVNNLCVRKHPNS